MKIGRNDPCPCGSGRKYKHCCLLDEGRVVRAAAAVHTPEKARQLLAEGSGIYTFRVELEGLGGSGPRQPVTRTIQIGGDETLYNLHLSIQGAFGWDNDHMFSFYLSGKLGDESTEYKGDPGGEWTIYASTDRSRSAADTEIRELGLRARRVFRYLFDYGDMLVHKVTVLAVRKAENGEASQSRVVASEGEPPRQYPYAEQ